MAPDVFESYSAGTETKPKINQDAVRIMKELYGIDMEQTQYSKLITDIPNPDVAISMGCNVGCPFIGRAFDDNWELDDPTGKSDEELVEGLLTLADCGATLIDLMGDLYNPSPEELTADRVAIRKQMELIGILHGKGAEVLLSSHVKKYTSAERVLEIALEHKRRGANISKIVTAAENMEQQIENLRITNLLKKEFGLF